MLADLPDVQTTESAREATPRVPVVIDHEYFPHIMEAIIAAAPPKSLAMLAATNRAFRERLGFATHVEVIALVPKKGSLLFYFHVPGTHGRPIPHLPDAFQGMTLRGDRGPRDPKVDEAFKWFYFVDMTLRNEGNFDPDVSLPREIWPMYVRMPGLGATFNISGIANYTVLVGPPGQDLYGLPGCPCHTGSVTIVIEMEPCYSKSCTRYYSRRNGYLHYHCAVHFVGPDARESSRLSPLPQSAPAACASPRHGLPRNCQVAVGTIRSVYRLYLYEDWGSANAENAMDWIEDFWRDTLLDVEWLSLEEYAASRNLTQAEINFERGVRYDL